MNWDQIKDDWDAASRTIKLTWGKLSEEDLAVISGCRERLVSVLQHKYGLSPAVAESRADQFARDQLR